MNRLTAGLCVAAVAAVASAQTFTRISVSSGGGQANGSSPCLSLSDDGGLVAFDSFASNLVAGDTNGVRDVFVRDRATGQTVRVSVDGSGAQLNGPSETPSISGNGRYVAYTYRNPVDYEQSRINIYDRDTGGVSFVGYFSTSDAFARPKLSYDGRRIVYAKGWEESGMGWSFWHWGVEWKDLDTGETIAFGDNTGAGTLSGDGRYAAYDSPGGGWYVYDTSAHSMVADGPGGKPALSYDGRCVAFETVAGLVPSDTDGKWDVYVKDLQTGDLTLASVAAGIYEALTAAISPDGRYVAFNACSQPQGVRTIYVYDVQTGATVHLGVSPWGDPVDGHCTQEALCSDPDIVALTSVADNLIVGDTNGEEDAYVCDLAGPMCVGLRSGWNMIGYMADWSAPVLLADCGVDDGAGVMSWDDAVAADLVQGDLFYYAQGAGYLVLSTGGGDDDSFRSGKGYWLLNRSGGDLILRIPR